MTAALAIRTHSHVVLAVDGRVTNDAAGVIDSDRAVKYVQTQHLAAVFAGDFAAVQDRLTAARCEGIAALTSGKRSGSWSALVYDRQTDQLTSLDSDGSFIEIAGFASIGSGSDVVHGFLAASTGRRLSVDRAARVARAAIRAAAKRYTTVGGRVRVLKVPMGTVRPC